MGSGAETAAATAGYLAARGERVGVVQVRLFRPFPAAELLAALPASAERVAVLDRTKEPGSLGEPLFLDVLATLVGSVGGARGSVVGCGRRPPDAAGDRRAVRAGVEGVHAGDGRGRLRRARARRRRARGSPSGSTTTSLDRACRTTTSTSRTRRRTRAVFFGLGSDGTVSANKNSIKILGDAGLHAQGYFVYDSKKSGSETVSHLRFGPAPVSAPYLIGQAGFVGVHQARLIGGPRCSTGPRPARSCCSTRRCRRRRCGTRCPRPPGRRSRRRSSRCTRSTPAPWPARPALAGGSTPCCRPASSRSPACCRPMRRSRRSSRRSRRATGGAARRSWRGTTRRWTRR